mgnify:CR=1 FL=1
MYDQLDIIATKASAKYLQGNQSRESLSISDPATVLLFIQIISELAGLLDKCKKPVKSLEDPTVFQKVIIRHSIKNYLGRDNIHLTGGVYKAILETGSELSEKEFSDLIKFIKEQPCEK